MACENEKCDTYGLHHEYSNGVEIRKCLPCTLDDLREKKIPHLRCHNCGLLKSPEGRMEYHCLCLR
jgi:hypothetical protein